MSQPIGRRLDVLRCFRRESPYHPWPTIREIAARAKIASTSVVNYHVHHLMNEGLLKFYLPMGVRRPDYHSRCIGLTEAGEALLDTMEVNSATLV